MLKIKLFKILFFRVNKKNKTQPEKYKNSGLSDSLAESLYSKLIQLMTEEKLYLDSDITLEILAKKIETNRHNVSQIINQFYQKKYSEFINDYRIEEAKKIILESKNLNVNRLIFDVGFSTKSNFYRAFKKRTNTTPSQFKHAHSKEYLLNPILSD